MSQKIAESIICLRYFFYLKKIPSTLTAINNFQDTAGRFVI